MKREIKSNEAVSKKAEKGLGPKAAEKRADSDRKLGWDGSMVVKVDIFGNKWVIR